MMITFFDINTLKTFDGSYPFIHWTEPLSTKVIRYKSLHFVSDAPICRVTMNVPEDWVFALYVPSNHDGEITEYDGVSFDELKDVAVGNLNLSGQQIDGQYFYQLIILCRSDVEGEFIEDFSIDGQVYKIGAEFWGCNEALKINLANQGTEISDIVCKAIYGSDLYEDDVDWVLLNRKLRELLVHHMDILDNKGSYKSLFNALQWFEYENLVELREVWKFQTPAGTKYFDAPVHKFLEDHLKDQLFNTAKTTFLALRNFKPNTVYDSDEQVVVDKLACKWSEEEMALKMVLLGNFFETYFMPLHSDLIRSCIEDLYTYDLMMTYGTVETYHEENYTESNDFDIEIGGDGSGGSGGNGEDGGDSDDPNNPNHSSTKNMYDLKEVHVYAGLPQEDPYGQAFENNRPIPMSVPYAFEQVPIIACHDVDDANAASIEEPEDLLTAMAGQFYNGIGCVLPFKFTFEENVISGECESNQWGDFIKTSFSVSEGFDKSFSVKFLFPTAGTFRFFFRFVGESGKIFTKSVDVTITNNLQVELGFFALVARTDKNDITPNPFEIPSTISYNTIRTKEHPEHYTEADNCYDLMLTDQAKQPLIKFIPVRSYNSDAHWQAPYLTPVTAIEMKGDNAQAALDQIIEDRDLNNSAWYDTLISDDGTEIVLRYLPKRRGAKLNTSMFAYDGVQVTQSTHEAFLPELHRLIPVPERVWKNIPIVCQPLIKLDGTDQYVPYSELVMGKPAWEFFSYGIQQNVAISQESQTDGLMAWQYAKELPVGKYRITFRYKFGQDEVEIVRNPNFKLVSNFEPMEYDKYEA